MNKTLRLFSTMIRARLEEVLLGGREIIGVATKVESATRLGCLVSLLFPFMPSPVMRFKRILTRAKIRTHQEIHIITNVATPPTVTPARTVSLDPPDHD